MLALRYLYALALALWLGGMIILGALVAPATFEVLQAAAPTSGRTLAGAVFGSVLRRFHLLSYACAAALLVSLVGRALLGPPPAGFRAQLAIVSAMLAITLYSGIPLTRQIERLQREIGTPVGTLPEGDAQRVRFDRLHRLSTTLMMVNVVGGLALLYWEARD